MHRSRRLITAAVLLTVGLAATTHADSTRHARLGRSVTLHGITGERMVVRPYKVARIEPTQFEDRALVGVWVTMRNAGRRTYSDSPSNGAKLVTRSGREVDSTIVVGTECDGGSSLKVPPRQKRVTCVAFEVPPRTRLRYFEFSLNSGFADELGQWASIPSV